jgi:hypothetical protein
MDVRIIGQKSIDRVLKGMPKQLTHRVLQTAHAAAGKHTVNAAKLLAPEGPTGRLIDSIGVIKTPIGRANSLGEIHIGPRRGRYKGFAAHLVEYGTVNRKLKGRGKYRRGTKRGRMKAKPFMDPAWRRTRDKVTGSINQEVGRVLINFMRRTIKSGV